MKKKIVVVIFALLFVSLLTSDYGCATRPAVKQDGENPVRLMSRIFAPVRGVDRELAGHIRARAKEKYDRIHVIVQFDTVPDIQARKRLEEMKVLILDPIPERAFFASMPANMSIARELIARHGVRWIGPIEPNDNVAPWILEEGVPEHAKRQKNAVALIVEFFGDVNETEQRQTLEKYDIQLLNRILPLNGWHVTAKISDIPRLAREDYLKWIVEIPPPPEDLNDGVRSVTGVNADPLYPPTGYNLSGAGVVVGQWESHASFTHPDYMARITLGDPPLDVRERGYMHTEAGLPNGQFDNGEAIYWDMDESGDVSAGDQRATTVGGFGPRTIVSAGPPADPDLGTLLVPFIQWHWINPYEGFTDRITADYLYTEGEGIYRHTGAWFSPVSAGDTRLTAVGPYPAGSIVSAGSAGPPVVPPDDDVGLPVYVLAKWPHGHATHVAGTIIGDGSQSAANGGTTNQWKGVAPGARIRSYGGNPITSEGSIGTDEYTDAANNGVSISTNSWVTDDYSAITAPNTYYEVGSQYYDAVVSGRRSDGTPTGLARSVLIIAAAGNGGFYVERYVDNGPANGQYDNGEAIYQDSDRDGSVSAGDMVLRDAAQPEGTRLSNFNSATMHDETINATAGTYNNGEGIYTDIDLSRTVTAGDIRVTATAGSGFADGSAVAAGDSDVGGLLKWFRPFATLAIPNSSKNTLGIGATASDTKNIAEFSSRGLTYDGRFKPDVAAPGTQELGDMGVTSTWPGNGYGTMSGTSMSTPAVSGCAALLEEWYKSALSPAGPSTALMRGLLIHGSEDVTNIPHFGSTFFGPDFASGYGRVRVKEAVDLMPHFINGTAAALGSMDYTFTIGRMDTLKITLVWSDPPWMIGAAPSAATGLLQNDLDLLLIAPDGTQYTPWIADPTNFFAPAVRSTVPSGSAVPAAAVDHRNPVEQVLVANAAAGTWTIRVTASSLNLPPQDYVLVGDALPPNASLSTLAAGDVWIRDNPTDDGTVPSSGAMYLGPDVWNRNRDDGLPDHQNPEYGQPNYLYANARNRSAVTVKTTAVDAWISTLALGLVWPDAFVYVGRFDVPNLAPGETRQVGPIAWSPQEVGHQCMYVRVSSPQDPITFLETSSVWTNAMNSNNIAYRNMEIVDLASSKSVTFLVRNTEKKEAALDIVVDTPDSLLQKGEVHVMLSPEMERNWPKTQREVEGLAVDKHRHYVVPDWERRVAETTMKGKRVQPQQAEIDLPVYRISAKKIVLKGFHMKPRQVEKMIMTFFSKDSAKAVYEVHVTQVVEGKARDGILFVVRTGYARKE